MGWYCYRPSQPIGLNKHLQLNHVNSNGLSYRPYMFTMLVSFVMIFFLGPYSLSLFLIIGHNIIKMTPIESSHIAGMPTISQSHVLGQKYQQNVSFSTSLQSYAYMPWVYHPLLFSP